MAGICEQIVETDTGTYKDLLYFGNLPQLLSREI